MKLKGRKVTGFFTGISFVIGMVVGHLIQSPETFHEASFGYGILAIIVIVTFISFNTVDKWLNKINIMDLMKGKEDEKNSSDFEGN